MATREYIVRFYYEEQARRSARLMVDIDDADPDPTEGMTERYIHELHKRVVQFAPYMEFVEDAETDNVVTIGLEDVETGEEFTRDLEVNSPRAWRESLAMPNAGEAGAPMAWDPLKQVLQQLSDSQVFAMSQGSRELFHSNMIAWLGKNRSSIFLQRLLTKLGIPAVLSDKSLVLREWNSFDLVIQFSPNSYLVIENKFKSIPAATQLLAYAAKAEKLRARGNTVHLVLLAPSCPIDSRQGLDLIKDGAWSFLTYEALAEVVEDVAERESDYYMCRLITEYALLIRRLICLRNLCSAESTATFLPGPDYDLLCKVKLHDLVYKWRYETLALRLEQLLGDRLYKGVELPGDKHFDPNGKTSVSSNFTHGTALVDMYRLAPGIPQEIETAAPMIGVQLQHDLLRFVVINVGIKSAKEILFSDAVEGLLTELSDQLKLTGAKERRKNNEKRGELNKFGPLFYHRQIAFGKATLDDVAHSLVGSLDKFDSIVNQT